MDLAFPEALSFPPSPFFFPFFFFFPLAAGFLKVVWSAAT